MGKKDKKSGKTKLPVATVAYYGPDDRTPTKVAVGIVTEWGKEPPELKRWWGKDVTRDLRIQKEIADFIKERGAKSVVITDGIIGCPHEEGIDFPIREDCPYCLFWRGSSEDGTNQSPTNWRRKKIIARFIQSLNKRKQLLPLLMLAPLAGSFHWRGMQWHEGAIARSLVLCVGLPPLGDLPLSGTRLTSRVLALCGTFKPPALRNSRF